MVAFIRACTPISESAYAIAYVSIQLKGVEYKFKYQVHKHKSSNLGSAPQLHSLMIFEQN